MAEPCAADNGGPSRRVCSICHMRVCIEPGVFVSPAHSPIGRRRASSQSNAHRRRDFTTPTKSTADSRMVILCAWLIAHSVGTVDSFQNHS